MSEKLTSELADFASWFHEHRAECTDPDKRTQFLEKAFDIFVWVFAKAVEDIQNLEGRRYARDAAVIADREFVLRGGGRRENGSRPQYPY